MGWILDGVHRIIQLPTKKCDKLIDKLRNMNTCQKISLKEMQSIQGKLQFASIAIPLGKHLLSTGDLRIAEAERNNWKNIRIDKQLIEYSKNWRALLHLMRSRPSHVKELIRNKEPTYQGFVDASKWGVGGVWFGGTQKLEPVVWYFQ